LLGGVAVIVWIVACSYLFGDVADGCSDVQVAQHGQRWEVNDLCHFTGTDDAHAKSVVGHF
jgi:hypothetical protein